MVEVICDTNFLIHLANHRIKNLDTVPMEIGTLTFMVPNVVFNELMKLQNNPSKKIEIENTLKYIKNLKRIFIDGTFADKELLEYVKIKQSIVATMDNKLKILIKETGSSIISFHNDKLILES